MTAPSLVEAMDDPDLFGPYFVGPSWDAWKAVLKGADAMPLSPEEFETFCRLTGRDAPPENPVREFWPLSGRRSGKTRVAATSGAHAATFGEYGQYMAPGERCYVMLIGVDKAQASVALNYIRAYFDEIPMLRALVERETANGLDLTNGVTIEVRANSYRSVRGRTIAFCVFDEVAHWMDDRSTNPDVEVLNAVLPSMATIPTARLFAITTPYARKGLAWQRYRDCWGHDGDVLVVKAASRDLNPSLPQRIVDDALAADPQAAACEWLGEFRSDIQSFLDAELVESAARSEPLEIPYRPGTRYAAFVDHSGGRQDAAALGIAHREGERVVVDLCRHVPAPFDPEHVTGIFCEVLKAYGLRQASGDRYGAGWVEQSFTSRGIDYRAADMTRSEIYVEATPLFSTGRIELPPDRKLLVEISQLERRTGRGKDIVDHPARGHDDLANAALGAAVMAEQEAVLADLGPAVRPLRLWA